MADEILIDDRGPVRVLAMNRPEKLNAINLPMTRALLESLRAASDDRSVSCIVLTGCGRAFCAGADLEEFKQLTLGNPILVEERALLTTTLHGAFPQIAKPTIAAVNGVAMGGGAGLALACDLTVAAASARIGYPEVKRGVVPAVVMANLVRVVRRKKAFELVATGEPVSAPEALAIGMLNLVVDDGESLAAAVALGERIAANSAEAVARTKALFYRATDVTFAEALEAGRLANQRMRSSRVS